MKLVPNNKTSVCVYIRRYFSSWGNPAPFMLCLYTRLHAGGASAHSAAGLSTHGEMKQFTRRVTLSCQGSSSQHAAYFVHARLDLIHALYDYQLTVQSICHIVSC